MAANKVAENCHVCIFIITRNSYLGIVDIANKITKTMVSTKKCILNLSR